jgi:hypothetical protein
VGGDDSHLSWSATWERASLEQKNIARRCWRRAGNGVGCALLNEGMSW